MDWLVLDVHSLAHRALHTTGGLSFEDRPTGVLFGLFRDLHTLTAEFGTPHVVWCFDRKPLLRKQDYPGYKVRKVDEEKAALYDGMEQQLTALRTKYLEDLGYFNVHHKPGYEADDVMAAVAAGLAPGDRAVLVSGDTDLYQLLSRTCAVYHPTPKRFVTARDFKAQWGIPPKAWATVKALAGCDTDTVPGIYGVGVKTAAAFLRGGFLGDKKKQKLIEAFVGSADYHRNQKLVRLPYPGIDPITPAPDPPRPRGAWRSLCERLGMSALAAAFADPPGAGGIDL